MMKKILVAYSTGSGSTEMVARTIGETIRDGDSSVDVRNIAEIADITGYSAVLLGGPMILGWHRKARFFLRKHREDFSRVPTALFFTAMEVTSDGGEERNFPVYIDPKLEKKPGRPDRLSFKEKHTTLGSYFKPIDKLCSMINPVGAAFFAGKLDYRVLKFPQMLFVMFVIQAKPGDFRNRERIVQWAESIKPLLM